MVVDNETGFLVQPDNTAALAGAIERVTNDRSLGQKLGQAGRERAQDLFSIEKNARELRALICSDLGSL
jgi:glycosyltransferase involved in cell wall biosynthesis